MHVWSLLHKTFREELPRVHLKRLTSLLTACCASASENKLYLTGIGRSISNDNKECSNIQRVDRLLGNKLLQAERSNYYRLMANYLLRENSSPWIHIDWTCVNSTTNLYVLRASLSMKGRSIVLYEQSYPKQKENNHPTHTSFLNKLKSLLPSGVKPVIVTDAGFRGPWFAHILTLGWDFVGRLRNRNLIYLDKNPAWVLGSTYFKQANSIPTYIGSGRLTEKGNIPVQCVLYKAGNKGRHKINKYKQKSCSGRSKRHAVSNKEPWLLVTSLQAKDKPVLITNIYRQRMRIEEHIRDTKSPHYGMGLKHSLTRCPQRLNILLLIAAIATFSAWLAGLYITECGKASDFQAHSAKNTSALSIVYLGRRVLKKGLTINQEQFDSACRLLYNATLMVQLEKPHYA